MTNKDLAVLKKQPIPPLIKMKDACVLLSLSRITIRTMMDEGTLQGVDINHFKKKKRLHLRITRESLMKVYQDKYGQPLSLTLAFPPQS